MKTVEVDYDNFEDLRLALQGHDVLISALGKPGLVSQPKLIDAAVAAHVQRIIPSAFGGDLKNAKCRQFPTYRSKIEAEEQLERHRAQSGTSYTYIFNSTLLDWGLTQGFLMSPQDRVMRIYDGGDTPFSTTTMATVGRAVVAVLDHYEETANRAIYIHDIAITQNELAAMALEATKSFSGKEWLVKHENTAELEAEAKAEWKEGVFSSKVFYGFTVRAAFAEGYGGHFKAVDNELLGIPEMNMAQVRDVVVHALT